MSNDIEDEILQILLKAGKGYLEGSSYLEMDSIILTMNKKNEKDILVMANTPDDPKIMELIDMIAKFMEEELKKEIDELPDNVTRIH